MDFNINEIERDVKALSALNSLLLESSIENNKAVDNIVKKVVEENYVISESIKNINDSLEKIGKIADSIGMAYENGSYGAVEKIIKEAM